MAPPEDARRPRSWPWGPLLVCLLVVAAFAPAVGFAFVNWDDDLHVYRNPLVVGAGPIPWSELLLTRALGYPIPLTVLTYRAEAHLVGLAPWLFHLTNVLLHLGAALLVYRIGRALGLLRAGARERSCCSRCTRRRRSRSPGSPAARICCRCCSRCWRRWPSCGGARPSDARSAAWRSSSWCSPPSRSRRALSAARLAVSSCAGSQPGPWRKQVAAIAPALAPAASARPPRARGSARGGGGRPCPRAPRGGPPGLVWARLPPRPRDAARDAARQAHPTRDAPAVRSHDRSAAAAPLGGGARRALPGPPAPRRRGRVVTRGDRPAVGDRRLPAERRVPADRALRGVELPVPRPPRSRLGRGRADQSRRPREAAGPPDRGRPWPRRGAGPLPLHRARLCPLADGVTLWRPVYARYPDSPEVCRSLGNAQVEARKLEDALGTYQRCARTLGLDPFAKNIGITLVLLGRLAEAEQVLAHAAAARIAAGQAGNPVIERYLQVARGRRPPAPPATPAEP